MLHIPGRDVRRRRKVATRLEEWADADAKTRAEEEGQKRKSLLGMHAVFFVAALDPQLAAAAPQSESRAARTAARRQESHRIVPEQHQSMGERVSHLLRRRVQEHGGRGFLTP